KLQLASSSTTPVATLDVRTLSGTLPVASISGKTSFASLVVDNSGLGDLFTASTSGTPKFTITNSGNLVFAGGQTGAFTTLTSAATGAQTITLPNATGTVCLQNSVSCGFVTGTNYWQSPSNGVIAPYNNTVDLLIG